MIRVFLDAQCLIAANLPRDVNHGRAIALLAEFEEKNARFVTTDAVIVEFCNMLSKVALRAHAAKVVRQLNAQDNIDVIHVTKEILSRAFTLYESRADKDWGLTDCISFEVMREQRITVALTTDHHFAQAGFQPLL